MDSLRPLTIRMFLALLLCLPLVAQAQTSAQIAAGSQADPERVARSVAMPSVEPRASTTREGDGEAGRDHAGCANDEVLEAVSVEICSRRYSRAECFLRIAH